MEKELTDEEFKKLEDNTSDLNENDEKQKETLIEAYRTIIDILKDYCDIQERYYPIISLWIIGTYIHELFPTYPYLFFNAMRGSGKSRVLRLITHLSNDGAMLNSLTEAVLFRTTGTLGIDEFEGISRKGNEALKELLNSAYKKGIKVKRMRKQKTMQGEQLVVEEFEVFRPILMANINGMEEVLGDRCINIILEKSNNPKVTKKMEIYQNDTRIQKIKDLLRERCRLCSVVVVVEVYKGWNDYINMVYNTGYDTNNTTYTDNTNNTNDTNLLFEKVNKTEIDGRNLELILPLLIMSSLFDEDVLNSILLTFKNIIEEKRKEDLVESLDISVYDFVSQELDNKWIQITELTKKFKEFIQNNDDWINERWMGKSLKRLNLIKDKKRLNYGRLVMLDVNKAQEKIRMFR